jgi:hypothetical protein
MSLTIADLIREFLGPQPDDCKHANLLTLAHALKGSGPVVRDGMVVSVKDVGNEVQVDFERQPFARVAATETTPERDPTDAELAEQWKLPLASDVPIPAPESAPKPAPTPSTP